MATFRLTDDSFDSAINENEIVLVDFWAEWCSTCSSFAPIYVQISETYPEIMFAKVNTQFEQDISAKYRIQSIPTLICFKNGQEVYRKPGAIPGQELIAIVDKIVSM